MDENFKDEGNVGCGKKKGKMNYYIGIFCIFFKN